MADIVVGVDIGTTGVKAVALGVDGTVYARDQQRVQHNFPQTGHAEQDPLALAAAVAQVVGAVVAALRANGHRLRALSFSSAMHGIFAIDAAGRPLTPLMTWADTRAGRQAEELRDALPDLYERTGVPMHPMLPAAKLRWLRDRWPGFHRAARFVSFKQWLLHQLCGRYVEDHATAAATGLQNVRTLDWDRDALLATGVAPDQLGELVPSSALFTLSSGDWLERLGLEEPTTVIVGATDGLLATVGSGVFGPRMYSVTAGTSGAVRKVSAEVELDQRGRTFSYILDREHWVTGGATNNAGLALSWLAEQVGVPIEPAGGDQAVMAVFEAAASVAAGSDGLLFLPYLSGERAPHWNERARGVFFGLDVRHTREHMLRAGIEGAALALRSVHDLLAPSAAPDAVVRASGGLFHSALWCQLVADVLGTPVELTDQEEVSAAGAAHYGFFALGQYRQLEDIGACVRVRARYEPIEEHVRTFDRRFAVFQDVYRRIEPCFDPVP